MRAIADPITSSEIAGAFHDARFTFTDEGDLQEGIAEAFVSAQIPFCREVRFNARDRIDFLIGGVGLEVKVASSAESVHRQLKRYAQSGDIRELILVTTRALHLAIPRTIGDKSLEIVFLGGVR